MLVAKNGNVVFEKAYGFHTYDSLRRVDTRDIYDLASMTKVLSTTLSIMKLYEEGKIALDTPISLYLPELAKTNKSKLTIRSLLLHKSGLAPGITFPKNIYTKAGVLSNTFRTREHGQFSLEVAEGLFANEELAADIWKKINASPLRDTVYAYSDLGFLYLGKIVEKVSGKPLEKFTRETFFDPLQLSSTTFRPLNFFSREAIVPSEYDLIFRKRKLQGSVQDPTAAWMGGVAGNAGLFANAHDVYLLMQMLLDGGMLKGHRLLRQETIDRFNRYYNESRRGLGFDKPDPLNDELEEPYPAPSATPLTFGHTGYTGTCAWADPGKGLVFVFLSNRLYPNNNGVFPKLNIRSKLQEAAYNAFP